MRPSDAMLDRLERVIETLQDNSVKMGQMLAVHDEKLDKQDRIDAVLFEKIESVHREVNRQSTEIKAGCERDIRKVDDRLRKIEMKMWSIAGVGTVVNAGLIILCPTGDTTKEITERAPKILHIFFSISLSLSSTLRISLSHPFLISSALRLTSL